MQKQWNHLVYMIQLLLKWKSISFPNPSPHDVSWHLQHDWGTYICWVVLIFVFHIWFKAALSKVTRIQGRNFKSSILKPHIIFLLSLIAMRQNFLRSENSVSLVRKIKFPWSMALVGPRLRAQKVFSFSCSTQTHSQWKILPKTHIMSDIF